jgi:hypothetical protein
MPLTLADARIKLTALTEEPADLLAITLPELAAGTDIECKVNKPDYRLSPTASDTVPDQPLCNEGNAVTFGNSNYEGSLTALRFLDANGQPDVAEDDAYTLLRTKGSLLWLVERTGPHYTTPWAEDDQYAVYYVLTDNPQKPTDLAGYIKYVIPLGVQTARLDGVVAARGGPPNPPRRRMGD